MTRTIHCRKCEQDLAVECFYPAYVAKGSKRGTCKPCSSKRSRSWNIANPNKAAESIGAYKERRAARLEQANGCLTQRNLHCRKCDNDLPVGQFYAAYVYEKSKVGICRSCSSRRAAEWKLANPNEAAEWRRNSEKYKQWRSDYSKKTRPSLNAYQKKWVAKNRDAVRSSANARGSTKRGTRIPPWADKAAMRAIYSEALRLTKATGVIHHVDHVIPLKGKAVSGLHVETNLQILTAVENIRKHNSF